MSKRNKGKENKSNLAAKIKENKVNTVKVEEPAKEKETEKVEKKEEVQPSNKPKEQEKKPIEKPKEEVKNTSKEEKKVEKKPEETKASVKPEKEGGKKEDKKPEPEKSQKKEEKKKEEKVETIIPETVDINKEKTEKQPPIDITRGVAMIANKERIDENHQVELLSLIRKTYIDTDEDLPREQVAAMKEVYSGGLCQLCLLYAMQLEQEGKSILKGITITKDVYPQIKNQFLNMYGVDVKALPTKDGKQLNLEFETVPEDVKKAAKADAKATKFEIPEADPKLTEEEKLNALRGILSRSNIAEGTKINATQRMALNVKDAIEWANKAFEVKSDNPTTTLALMYSKFNQTKTLCLKGLMSKASGALIGNNSPYIAHSLLYKDFEGLGYNEQQIADFVKVMLANSAEEFATEKTGADTSVTIFNDMLSKSSTNEIIKKIANKEENIPVTIEGMIEGKYNKDFVNKIKGDKIFSVINNMYNLGDSTQLVQEKLTEIAGLYKDPVKRLANYIDESAYSKA